MLLGRENKSGLLMYYFMSHPFQKIKVCKPIRTDRWLSIPLILRSNDLICWNYSKLPCTSLSRFWNVCFVIKGRKQIRPTYGPFDVPFISKNKSWMQLYYMLFHLYACTPCIRMDSWDITFVCVHSLYFQAHIRTNTAPKRPKSKLSLNTIYQHCSVSLHTCEY